MKSRQTTQYEIDGCTYHVELVFRENAQPAADKLKELILFEQKCRTFSNGPNREGGGR